MINLTESTLEQLQEILVAARTQKHLTQTEIGAKIGVLKSRMCTIESNISSLSTEKFLLLVKELGCSIHFKANDDSSANPSDAIDLIEKWLSDYKNGDVTSDFVCRKISKILAKL